ncbi:MAG: hypothetical protein ACQGVK_13875 [Myxococcota bacterium]
MAFSSLGAAAVAAALVCAVARVLGVEVSAAMVVLAFGGTGAVYGVDRLRDVERDRLTAPQRTAFVERHRRVLSGVCAGVALAAVGSAASLGPAVATLCAGVLALGLAHRRLKHVPIFKGLYVTGAWLAVVVGVPALDPAAKDPGRALWAAAVVGSAILGNVVASSFRDSEAGAGHAPGLALRIARALPALGLGLAWWAPAEVRPLAWIPAALLLALVRRPEGERYGLVAVDGSLLVGALLSMIPMG